MYGIEIRKKVIELLKRGKSKEEISDILGMSVRTIERWIRCDREGGDLSPRTHGSRHRKVNQEALLAYVKKHADHTLKEIAQVFKTSHVSIFYHLKKAGITLKKRPSRIRSEMKKQGKSFDRRSP